MTDVQEKEQQQQLTDNVEGQVPEEGKNKNRMFISIWKDMWSNCVVWST